MARKKHAELTKEQLRGIRVAMKYSKADMARVLGWPYRTYQDRESGARGISGAQKFCVLRAYAKDRRFFAELPARIDAAIEKEFPNGIPSEPDADFDI